MDNSALVMMHVCQELLSVRLLTSSSTRSPSSTSYRITSSRWAHSASQTPAAFLVPSHRQLAPRPSLEISCNPQMQKHYGGWRVSSIQLRCTFTDINWSLIGLCEQYLLNMIKKNNKVTRPNWIRQSNRIWKHTLYSLESHTHTYLILVSIWPSFYIQLKLKFNVRLQESSQSVQPLLLRLSRA